MTTSMGRREGGFSLIEMVIVIMILGILASITAPAIDGIGPRARLRAGARELGALISDIRAHVGVQGVAHHLHYDLEARSAWIILPPRPDDDPDLDLDERERLSPTQLPRGVQIQKILYPDGTMADGQEKVDIEIDPLGYEGDHIVFLENSEGTVMAVRYNALLGEITFFDKEVEFEEY